MDSAVWPFRDGTVDESSTVADQFALLMQIGNLPDEALAGVAEPEPVPVPVQRGASASASAGASQTPRRGPHLRRRAQAPARPSSCLITMRTRGAVRPGCVPRSASMRGLPYSQAGRIFPGQRGSRGFGSGKRVTVMHVHPG